MRSCHRLALVVTAVSFGCAGGDTPLAPDAEGFSASDGPAPLVAPVLLGTGHHLRTVAGVTVPTLFSFQVTRAPDGTIGGKYKYNFQAVGFYVEGRVTCATTSGNQAWVSGVVDKVVTSNPDFESLLGLEMWWRSKDGKGTAAPDSTTGLGFGFPGGTITAESWCRDQPVALVIRAVDNAELMVQ